MSKVKITEPALSEFTGVLSGVEFVKGVSVGEVTQAKKDQIGASLRLAEIVDGQESQVGAATTVSKGFQASADSVKEDRKSIVGKPKQKAEQKTEPEKKVKQSEVKQPAKTYTEEELAKVADEKGIAGLRDIADDFGVKGRSIRELITEIMQKQGA